MASKGHGKGKGTLPPAEAEAARHSAELEEAAEAKVARQEVAIAEVYMYRWSAQDGAVHVRTYMGFSYIKYSLANILLFHYRTEVLRWQVPQSILFYHRDEVRVPQAPLVYGILVGYGSKSSTTLDSDCLRKIPHARGARAREARGGPSLTCDDQFVAGAMPCHAGEGQFRLSTVRAV
jgi:hypothetical protein